MTLVSQKKVILQKRWYSSFFGKILTIPVGTYKADEDLSLTISGILYTF